MEICDRSSPRPPFSSLRLPLASTVAAPSSLVTPEPASFRLRLYIQQRPRSLSLPLPDRPMVAMHAGRRPAPGHGVGSASDPAAVVLWATGAAASMASGRLQAAVPSSVSCTEATLGMCRGWRPAMAGRQAQDPATAA
ncbi:unnamed protein product [Urochloa humidicola]